MKHFFDLLARMMLSTIFIFEAYDSISFYGKTKNTMTAYGVTWNQDFLLITVIGLLVIGATLVLLGYYANLGAILLLCYMIPITFIVYSFWDDPADVKHIQSIMFMKNIAIIGGLLLLMVNGSGKWSVNRLVHVLRLPK